MEWYFYNSSGIYTDTLQSLSGCDSLVSLDLTINSSHLSDTSFISSCDSLEWNGTVYNLSGIYTDTLKV